MVYRIYVEKKQGLRHEADALYDELKNLLGIEKLEKVRLFNRYDVENISEKLFSEASRTVFAEPQLDVATKELPETNGIVFATEYLPGQFDQRADSASQCIRIIFCGDKPTIRTAKVYVLEGDLSVAGTRRF